MSGEINWKLLKQCRNNHQMDRFAFTIDEKEEEWVVDITCPPRFSGTDPTALEFLNRYGYVVIKILSEWKTEIWPCHELFWDWAEAVTDGRLHRKHRKTWNNYNWEEISSLETGVCSISGIAHSKFMTSLRDLPELRDIFCQIYNCSPKDLEPSLDGCGAFRPWSEEDPEYRTQDPWFHLDQNYVLDGDINSYQGILHLTPATMETGGFLIASKSHLKYEATKPMALRDPTVHFTDMREDYDPETWGTPKFVQCYPGDFVVFNSKCIHCNVPALEPVARDDGEKKILLRLVAYITFYPRALVSRDVLRQRREAKRQKRTLTHHVWDCVVNENVEDDDDGDVEMF